jgi:hypothetical protein
VPPSGAKERFVTAFMEDHEPLEEGCGRQDLSGHPGRDVGLHGKPDTPGCQREAEQDQRAAAGILWLKMPELAWNGWPGGSFVPLFASHRTTIRLWPGASPERPVRKDEER